MKLARIIIIILVTFVLASLFIYRLHIGRAAFPQPKGDTARPLDFTLQTADGRVDSIDISARKILVVANGSVVVFNYDGSTDFMLNNRAIAPSPVISGNQATVRFMRRGDANLAQTVLLSTPQ